MFGVHKQGGNMAQAHPATFLDMITNYFEHTGTQTVARRLIERAVNAV